MGQFCCNFLHVIKLDGNFWQKIHSDVANLLTELPFIYSLLMFSFKCLQLLWTGTDISELWQVQNTVAHGWLGVQLGSGWICGKMMVLRPALSTDRSSFVFAFVPFVNGHYKKLETWVMFSPKFSWILSQYMWYIDTCIY